MMTGISTQMLTEINEVTIHFTQVSNKKSIITWGLNRRSGQCVTAIGASSTIPGPWQ